MSPLLAHICGKCKFRVEIDGIQQAGFREVEGIGISIDSEEYREGTKSGHNFETVPGLVHYSPIILRGGITSNMDIFNWMLLGVQGKENKKNMAIVVLDREGNDYIRIEVGGAWPSSWRLSKLDSHSGSPLIEELTIQCDNLKRVK